MKKYLVFITISLFFVACKKEKNTNSENSSGQPGYTYAASVGSYWVYDRYVVDSLGNETLVPATHDSITVIGDTIANGKTYFKFKGEIWGNGNLITFQRDSSGYIVDIHGTIIYSFNNVSAQLSSSSDNTYTYATGLENNSSVTTAFGVKNACVSYFEASRLDGNPINVCGDLSVRYHNYYVSGIGMVQNEKATYAQMMNSCSKIRSKLSSYYIAP